MRRCHRHYLLSEFRFNFECSDYLQESVMMLTIRGKYSNGKVELMEEVPFDGELEVLVTFLTEEDSVLVVPRSEHQDTVKFASQHRLSLTSREIEILQLMYHGLTNDEIAQRLDLSHGTVRNYTASIYRKMNVKNRTEAVKCAADLGLLDS